MSDPTAQGGSSPWEGVPGQSIFGAVPGAVPAGAESVDPVAAGTSAVSEISNPAAANQDPLAGLEDVPDWIRDLIDSRLIRQFGGEITQRDIDFVVEIARRGPRNRSARARTPQRRDKGRQ